MESGRTQEWAETSQEYKDDHYECEMCGEAEIEAHDILPYHLLTEIQRHDRDFLKQNFISLCYKHHHIVAHRGDPLCIKFNPRIREIAERRLRQKRLNEEREKQERYAMRREDLRLIQERDAKRRGDLKFIAEATFGKRRP